PKKWSAGRILGRGAFGECSLAMDHDTGRLMAVKRIKVMGSAREVAESVKALRQEVDVLSSLHHPHVVGAIGVSFDAGGGDSEHELHSHTNSTGFQAGGGDAVPVVSIWMDFMEGGSLSSIIAEFGALPEKVVATYTKQLVLGLEHLHAKNIVHGDIKPANILLDKAGVVKISDFGCAQVPPAGGVGDEGKLQGTPQYMAPEVIRGQQAGPKADVWAVGLTVLEALSGKAGYDMSNKQALMFKIGRGVPPEISAELSASAHDFVTACTRREPADRPDASEML
ncbi:kinase-like domain-containing protein, partial [Baffinella frigidus]